MSGSPARCIVERLDAGRGALQCQVTRDIDHFDEELLHALVFGEVAMLAIGMASATAFGTAAVRRLDNRTASIKIVMEGDLTGRLPLATESDEVGRLMMVVNRMLDDIERLMHEVKGVCDAIAHDLRTPLTRLLASLERAQRRAHDPADHRAVIDDAATNCTDSCAPSTRCCVSRRSKAALALRRSSISTSRLSWTTWSNCANRWPTKSP